MRCSRCREILRGKSKLGLRLGQPFLELFELIVACATRVHLIATWLIETIASLAFWKRAITSDFTLSADPTSVLGCRCHCVEPGDLNNKVGWLDVGTLDEYMRMR